MTIVVPAYNEEANLPELFRRVTHVVEPLVDCEFEFLVIDNCSEDNTEGLCREQVERDSRWRYIRFSRNFTAEVSLAAGLHYARGDALIFLFSDLQDPPELIPTMLAKWREGNDVVYGRLECRHDSLLKSTGARIAYRLIYWLSEVRIPPNATDLRLISRPVIEALRRCGERNRYMRGLVHWVGFRQADFTYERAPRPRGRSSAGILFCVNFALTAVVAFSVQPLRWASILGLTFTGLSMLGAALYVALKILVVYNLTSFMPPPPGWTTMILLILFFGGVQSLFMGILGEYLAKTYIEVKQRPMWVVHRTAGFPREEDPLKPEGVCREAGSRRT